MTTDPEPTNQSDLDDEVTLAASDQAVREMRAETRAETQRERSEMSVWTTDDSSPVPAEAPPAADDSGADSDAAHGLADEPTVIRGFGDDPTTPLDDQAKSQIATHQQESAPVSPAPVSPAPVNAGPSLIDGLEPPTSETAFFGLEEIAPESPPEVHTSTRGSRFPIALLALGVLVVAVTVTVVLAVLLGSSAL